MQFTVIQLFTQNNLSNLTQVVLHNVLRMKRFHFTPTGGGKRDAETEDGAAVGIHSAGRGEHVPFGRKTEFDEFLRSAGGSHAGEPRADGRYPLLHQGVVHIGMGPGRIRADEAGLEGRVEFHPERTCGEFGQQIRVVRRRGQAGGLAVASIRQCAADAGCAHRHAVHTETRHDKRLDVESRQYLAHQRIVTGGQAIFGLLPHKADTRPQRRCDMPGKEIQVQAHLRLGGLGKVLEEIGRESSRGNLISGTFGKHHAGDRFQHGAALGVWEKGHIFLHRNNKQCIDLPQGGLEKVPMAQGKRIGMHHHDPADALARQPREVAAVSLQFPAVFQQDGLRRLGDQMESQALEKRHVLRFGKDFQIPATLPGDNPGYQRSHEPFAAMGLVHGDTFDDITPNPRTRQEDAVVTRHGIIRINFLKGEPIVTEEAFHLRAEKGSAQRHLRYVVILILFHPFSKHSNTPGSACHGIMLRMYGFIVEKARFPYKFAYA